MKGALGIMEVTGLSKAIVISDIMAKSANIKINKLEKTNGNGWITIMITGDVGSVNAAIESGVNLAKDIGGLQAWKIIARPNKNIDEVWLTEEKKPELKPEPEPELEPEPKPEPKPEAEPEPKPEPETADKKYQSKNIKKKNNKAGNK